MSTKRFYAAAADGRTLPIVDVTHGDFAIELTESELETRCHDFVVKSATRQDVSPAVREALEHSTLGRGLMAASGSFLSGMTTYLLKLGPHNLGDWATLIDKNIAASFPALVTRLRLQDISRLLADGAFQALAGSPRRNLAFINIAGGVAADSWNALLHLNAQHPHLLDDRTITISVLDVDPDGAAFGRAAVAALSTTDGPFNTTDVSVAYVDYTWTDASHLAEILEPTRDSGAACAVSSEGGLFEYGTDADIVANLQCLHRVTVDDAFVVGSVTRDNEATRAARMGVSAATRPRTLARFSSLCDAAGWRPQRIVERPFTYNLLLAKC
jgi:hypothetical protein